TLVTNHSGATSQSIGRSSRRSNAPASSNDNEVHGIGIRPGGIVDRRVACCDGSGGAARRRPRHATRAPPQCVRNDHCVVVLLVPRAVHERERAGTGASGKGLEPLACGGRPQFLPIARDGLLPSPRIVAEPATKLVA